LTSDFLDELNICKTEGATVRDDLTWCRQHSFLVTHNDTIQRHNEDTQRRMDDANPLIIAQRQQTQSDLRQIAKDDAKRAKVEAAAVAKALEVQRKAALSPEERQMEKEAAEVIKLLNAQNKAQNAAVTAACRARQNI
jgi:hypothetical protein